LDQLSFFKEKAVHQFVGERRKEFIHPHGSDAGKR
jgi:hypothetical protein